LFEFVVDMEKPVILFEFEYLQLNSFGQVSLTNGYLSFVYGICGMLCGVCDVKPVVCDEKLVVN